MKFHSLYILSALVVQALSSPVPADPERVLPLAATANPRPGMKNYVLNALNYVRFDSEDDTFNMYSTTCRPDIPNTGVTNIQDMFTCHSTYWSDTSNQKADINFFPYKDPPFDLQPAYSDTPRVGGNSSHAVDVYKLLGPKTIADKIVKDKGFKGQFIRWHVRWVGEAQPTYYISGRTVAGNDVTWLYKTYSPGTFIRKMNGTQPIVDGF